MHFPWTVSDYPMAQAVEDCIVKALLVVTKENDPKQSSFVATNCFLNFLAKSFMRSKRNGQLCTSAG